MRAPAPLPKLRENMRRDAVGIACQKMTVAAMQMADMKVWA
jgi:hypothetical protein